MKTTKKRKVTEAQVKKVLKAVKEQFPKWDTEFAKIVPDWYGEGTWAIVWSNGAPDEWTMDFEWTGENLHCEAYDMNVICVYAETRE